MKGTQKLKLVAVKLHWLLANQFGIDLYRLLLSLYRLPFFFRDWLKLRHMYTGKLRLVPCLHDRYEEGGAVENEYFWQDLLVARWIYAASPLRHVDVGSRVDGFVAHVAAFREIEVFDVRPITAVVPGVTFKQADLMSAEFVEMYCEEGDGYCDSLSCLHAIEHFGLGRYGDPIDVNGYQCGMANLAKLLRPKGTFYLATPIGEERVEFNANWVFDPHTIISCAKANGLMLEKLTVVNSQAGPEEIILDEESLLRLANSEYNLGIFIFKKLELEFL